MEDEKIVMDDKIKVIYILGAGRSGSTLIDTVLGQHENVFGCGELGHFAHPFMNDVLCSCGELFPLCSLWSGIRKQWEEKIGISANHYLSLQQFCEMYQTPYDKGISQPWRFCKEMKRSLWPLNTSSTQFKQYAESTALLFKLIAEHTGKKIIVDSSKRVHRAYLLSKISEIELYILRLVRDGRGVMNSTKKKLSNQKKQYGWDSKPLPVWRAAVSWVKTNLLCDFAASRHIRSRFFFCRYEDFARDPGATLQALGAWLKIDFNGVTELIQ